MSELLGTFEQLSSFFGNQATFYEPKEDSHHGDEFWYEESGWEEQGESHQVLIEEELSEDTLQQAGFADEAEIAIWTRDEVAGEGWKMEWRGNDWVIISISDMNLDGGHIRRILGARSLDG